MSRQNSRTPALIGIACMLAFMGLFLYFMVEKVSDERTVPASGEARFNSFLAVERLLTRMGVPATSARTVEVPATRDTALLVLTSTRILSEGRVEALHSWVSSGGHLIVAAPISGGPLRRLVEELRRELERGEDDKDADKANDDASDEDEANADEAAEEEEEDDDEPIEDPLLARFGVTLMRLELWQASMSTFYATDDTGAARAATVEVQADTWIWEPEGAGRVEFDEPAVIQMDPWPEATLVAGPRYALRPPTGEATYGAVPALVQIPYGQGWLTVLPSPDPWDNYEVGHADHAEVLWTLLSRPGAPTAAVVVYAHDAPALSELLWSRAWPAVISALVLLVAVLWASSRRFGPLLAPPAPAVRSLGEHIEATGRYLWRAGHRDTLLVSAQRAARARLLQGAALADDGPDAVVALAVERTGLDPAELRAALYGTDIEHPIQFTRSLRALTRILAARSRRPQ